MTDADSSPGPSPGGSLRTLSILHFVWAAMGIVGLGVIAVYGWTVWPMLEPEYINAHGDPLPDVLMMFVPLMKWWVVVVAAYQLTMMALNVCVGRWLLARRRWYVCAAVSGLNCVRIPLGPVLGASTLFALNRPGVRASFS